MPSSEGTLRGTLLRWLLIPLSVLFAIDAVGSYFIAASLSRRVYDGELMEIARELALHVRRAGEGIGFDLESDAERTLLLDEFDKVYYAVRSATGGVVAGDPSLRPPDGIESRDPGFHDDTLHGDPVRVAVLRTGADAGSGAPPAVIEVAETLGKRRTLTREIFIDGLLPQLLLILIAGGMVWVGVARGLLPLQHLQRAVAARSHVDLSPVTAADVPGEVHALVDAINDLMARLDDVLSLQSRFIADAAHQLRTPVAGLKAHVELALREDDPAQTRRALAHLYTGVDRLARLVSQLLSLARNEPSSVRAVALAPVDLGSLVLEATKQWVPEAYKRGVDLGYEGAERAQVNGDAVRLTELVDNLIDNAIRYSRPGGHVTVRVAAHPVPCVSVSDDGPTIPVAERERVFERFHRLLGTSVPGSGLGLAIVREIATLHGATITLADDTDGVGNTFTVSFPEFRPTPPAAA